MARRGGNSTLRLQISSLQLPDFLSFARLDHKNQRADRRPNIGTSNRPTTEVDHMSYPAVPHRIGVFLLSFLLVMESGCVTRQAYEKVLAEGDELTRNLESARADVTQLDRQIAELQAANRREDTVTSEVRAAIRHEQDQLPLLRQRADNQLASLQSKIAHLVNQTQKLTRQIAEAKHETVSLRTLSAQYEQELEEARMVSAPVSHDATEATSSDPNMEGLFAAPATTSVNPVEPVPQVAQASPVAQPKPVPTPVPAKVEPAPPVDDSWTGMIMEWFSSLWSWIFG